MEQLPAQRSNPWISHLRRAALGPTDSWDRLPTVLAVELSVALLALVLYHGFWFSAGQYSDFRVYWVASQLLLSGASPYDLAAQEEAQRAIDMELLPYLNPPWFLFFTTLPATQNLEWASRLWFGFNFVALVFSAWVLFRTLDWDRHFSWGALGCYLLAILALFIPVLKFLGSGQSTVWGVLLPLAGALYGIKQGRAFIAGLGLAWTATEPGLGVLAVPALVLWLAFRRGWSALFWFVTVSVALLALSFLLLGPSWPRDYLFALQHASTPSPMPRLGDLRNGSLLNLLYLILGQGWLLQTLYGGIAALLAAHAFYLWYRDAKSAPSMTNLLLLRIGLLVAATLLITPYLQDYDYVLLLIPIAAALAVQRDARPPWRLLIPLSLLFMGVLYLVLWVSPLNWVSLVYVWAPALWYGVTTLAPGALPATRATGNKLR